MHFQVSETQIPYISKPLLGGFPSVPIGAIDNAASLLIAQPRFLVLQLRLVGL